MLSHRHNGKTNYKLPNSIRHNKIWESYNRASYLEEAACTTHARSDADVLIIQTAIQSSGTANTVVVGEDTDLKILLLHRTTKELYFRPEPKQNAKKVNIKSSKKSWDPVFALSCCSSMQLLAVIPLLGCMALARHFLKSSAVMNSLKLVKCLCKKMPIRRISSALEKKHLSFSTMVIQRMT